MVDNMQESNIELIKNMNIMYLYIYETNTKQDEISVVNT